jgi:hypothetical protein
LLHREALVRFDLCPVLPFADDDGVTREAVMLAERDGLVDWLGAVRPSTAPVDLARPFA